MDDETVARATAQYPPADITPAEFEAFVAEMLQAEEVGVTDFAVRPHERIKGPDGEYDFDATGRFQLGGMAFLVIIEAKRHSNPIKRELVQVLHQKMVSVGAQKAMMVSTAPFQSGALGFALAHGIALVTVTEGRFTFHTRSKTPTATISREEAATLGINAFVGYMYSQGTQAGSVNVSLLDVGYRDTLASWLSAPPDDEEIDDPVRPG